MYERLFSKFVSVEKQTNESDIRVDINVRKGI